MGHIDYHDIGMAYGVDGLMNLSDHSDEWSYN
jgi:hypothetical protein